MFLPLLIAAVCFPPVTAAYLNSGNSGSQSNPEASAHSRRDSYADMGTADAMTSVDVSQSRQLQFFNHGNHSAFANPRCPRCRIWGISPSGVFCTGHCRWRRTLRCCIRWCLFPYFFSTSASSSGSSTRAVAPVLEEVMAVFQVDDGSTSSTVAGVGCFDDSDCALPADDFAPLNGSAPMSSAGTLAAQCVRIAGEGGATTSDEAPGVCVCIYAAADVASGASAPPAAEAPPAPPESFKDVCVRRSTIGSVSIASAAADGLQLVSSADSDDVVASELEGGQPENAGRSVAVAIGEDATDELVSLTPNTPEYNFYVYD